MPPFAPQVSSLGDMPELLDPNNPLQIRSSVYRNDVEVPSLTTRERPRTTHQDSTPQLEEMGSYSLKPNPSPVVGSGAGVHWLSGAVALHHADVTPFLEYHAAPLLPSPRCP